MNAQWVSGKYNFHHLILAGGFDVVVDWDGSVKNAVPGYRVTFQGAVLKVRFTSLDEAKTAGEKLAKTRLLAAIESLPEVK